MKIYTIIELVIAILALLSLIIILTPNAFAEIRLLNTSAILADSFVDSSTPTTNQGTANNVGSKDDGTKRGYIMYNISNLSDCTIIDAMWYVNTHVFEATDIIHVKEVNVSSVSWAELDITWNNQPCGTQSSPITSDNGGNCNATNTSSVSVTTEAFPGNTWYKFNVTPIVQKQRDKNNSNFSFIIEDKTGNGAGNNNVFDSKEGTNPHYLNVSCGVESPSAPAGPDYQKFTFQATNLYDSSTINNITVRIFNSTWDLNVSTINGTIILLNNSRGTNNNLIKFNVTYNLTFISNESNRGYFNVSYNDFYLNNSKSLTGEIFQSLLNLYVNDSLIKSLISSFTVTTNRTTTSVTGGYILLYTKAGSYHVLNISSSQYPKQTHIYDIEALQNKTMYVNLSPQFQFYLRREADNSVFDINGTNTTRLTIFCPEKNIVVWFKNGTGTSPSSKVSTQENATVDCAYTLLKMDVTYASSSYFRSLIPAKTQQNVTWWLLDLNKDTGVQIIINLRDLTGDFSQGILRVKTAISGNNENIIEEYFDISTSVVLYLLKDALYKIILINNDQTQEKQLGDLIADAAGTKTITTPDIKFIPDTILDNNISWSYTFNATGGILRLQYQDSTKNTTYIRWRIYNGTNASLNSQISIFESVYVAGNFTTTTYTYNNVQFNRSYYTHLFVQHAQLGFNISEYRSFGEYQNYLGAFVGFTEERAKDIKHYGSAIFLSVWMLLFSARHLAIGLTSTLFWIVILKTIDYFLIGWIWIMIIGLITFFAWIGDYMRRN